MARAHSVFYIWFTTNPSDPLGKQVNWQRIHNWRAIHPASKYGLSIVFSMDLLNEEGKNRLKTLEETCNITVVDVGDIKAHNPIENFLLNFAKNEINKGRNYEGNAVGHFAAASDILRVMRYLLQNYGTYSDMDGFMNLQLLEDNTLDGIPFFMPEGNACLWVKNRYHPAIEVFQQLQFCNILLESEDSYNTRHELEPVRSYQLRGCIVRLTGLIELFDIGEDTKEHIGMWNEYARRVLQTPTRHRYTEDRSTILSRDSYKEYGPIVYHIFYDLFQHHGDWMDNPDQPSTGYDFNDMVFVRPKKVKLNPLQDSEKAFIDIMCDAITEIDADPGLSTEKLTLIKTSIFEHPKAENQYEYVLWFAAYLQQKQYLTFEERKAATTNALSVLTILRKPMVKSMDGHHRLRLFSAAATYLKTLNSYCLETINVHNVTEKWKEKSLKWEKTLLRQTILNLELDIVNGLFC